jgi:hypothetical protein
VFEPPPYPEPDDEPELLGDVGSGLELGSFSEPRLGAELEPALLDDELELEVDVPELPELGADVVEGRPAPDEPDEPDEPELGLDWLELPDEPCEVGMPLELPP